jgi:IS5 family transposase
LNSTKNKAGARDPEMSSTRKGNDWYFGMKAHVGVDAQSGIVHSLDTTTAKVHDSQVWDELLHGAETSLWAELPLARHWSERQWRRLCQRGAGGRVRGPRQVLGRDEEGPQRAAGSTRSKRTSTGSSPGCGPGSSTRSG